MRPRPVRCRLSMRGREETTVPKRFKVFLLLLFLMVPIFSYNVKAEGTYQVVIEDEEDLLTDREEKDLALGSGMDIYLPCAADYFDAS